MFFSPVPRSTALIIVCRGATSDGRIQKCRFSHDGEWGDRELVEHQRLHESARRPGRAWLGFDLPQPFGAHSGRDGKRS